MRILIVANHNKGSFSPFVVDQVNALQKLDIEIEYFGIEGKGISGYLKNLSALKRKIKEYQPDLIHAHYGLSGLLANMQREVPVVTTYHGSDIHSLGLNLRLSRLCMQLSAFNIFVNNDIKEIAGYKAKNSIVQSCGVTLSQITINNKMASRQSLGLDQNHKFVLFTASFNNEVKNPKLAKEAVKMLGGISLIELKSYTRDEVNLLMNAVDCLLVTSHRETGPLVVKEAMACGTPIVSVDVGDVKEVIGNTNGCYIAERTPEDIAEKLQMALSFKSKTNGRQRIIDLGLSNDLVAAKIKEIYVGICNNRKRKLV